MAITRDDLANRIKTILDGDSDNEKTNPMEARQRLAEGLAQAVNDFVVGRTTKVSGTTTDGHGVTGEGIIQGN